jgi:hypothetical protein
MKMTSVPETMLRDAAVGLAVRLESWSVLV